MKIKPKEVLVNLPVHFEFENEDELAQMASNINSVLAGRTRVKYEIMGDRGDKIVGLLYLERNREYSELREFIKSYVLDPEEAPPQKEDVSEPEESAENYCIQKIGCNCNLCDSDPYKGCKP